MDPMYQYALPWFSALFCKSIGQAPPAVDLEGRLQNLNDCFTAAVYVNVCRSLFEAHKLLFSFLLQIKILQVTRSKAVFVDLIVVGVLDTELADVLSCGHTASYVLKLKSIGWQRCPPDVEHTASRLLRMGIGGHRLDPDA